MKIAYEYSMPTSQQLTLLGMDERELKAGCDCAVTAFDGEQPIGFGYMPKTVGAGAECRIQVLPSYEPRQIDENIRKLLHARRGEALPKSGRSACV